MSNNLVNLIGLVRTQQACYPDLPTDPDVTASLLDVFLESVEYINLSQAAASYPSTFWERLLAARQDAATDLKSDLLAFLAGKFPPRQGFSGQIGAKTCTQYAATDARLMLYTRTIAGATIRVPQLGLLVSQPLPGQVVQVRRMQDTTPLFSATLSIAARSSYQHNMTGWVLPCDGSTYVFESVLPADTRAGDNIVSCGCGSNMNALLGYGFTNTTTAQPSLTGRAGGFMLTLQTSCSADPLIDILSNDSRISLVLAWMLAYKTAYRLLVQPWSGEVERATVLNVDTVATQTSQCDAAYQNRLSWLRANCPALDLSGTCLTTPRVMGWSRGGINTGY